MALVTEVELAVSWMDQSNDWNIEVKDCQRWNGLMKKFFDLFATICCLFPPPTDDEALGKLHLTFPDEFEQFSYMHHDYLLIDVT